VRRDTSHSWSSTRSPQRLAVSVKRVLPEIDFFSGTHDASRRTVIAAEVEGVSSDQVIRLISAVGGLLGVLAWPAVVLFFLVRFRRALTDFFSDLGELSLKAPGMEARAKRQQVEFAAAMGAAVVRRRSR
jgi:hypothetical protein